MRILVAMSGGVDSSTVAGLLHEAGHEVIGVTLQLYDHGAATGPQGRVLRRPGHPRRAPGGRPSRHPALRDRRRAALRRCGDRRLRRQLCGRRDAGALRALQPDGEVRRPDRAGRGSGLRAAGDRALCAADRRTGRRRNCTAPSTWRATRAGSCSPPRASSLRGAVPAGRDGRQAGGARARPRRLGLPVAAKPDSQDICFVPSGTLCRHGGAAAPGCRRAGRHRRRATGACWGGTTGSRATRSVRASGSARPRSMGPAADGGCARSARGGGSSWARAIPARDGSPARGELADPAAGRAAGLPGEAARARDAAAQSAQRCRAAPRRVRRAEGCVQLATPALPAPGQACVFYDGSRVLGGGFICRPDGGDG